MKGQLIFPVIESGLKNLERIITKEAAKLRGIDTIKLLSGVPPLDEVCFCEMIKLIGTVTPGLTVIISPAIYRWYCIKGTDYGHITKLILNNFLISKIKGFSNMLSESQITSITVNSKVVQNRGLVARRICQNTYPGAFNITVGSHWKTVSRVLLANKIMMDNYRAAVLCFLCALKRKHKWRVSKDVKRIIVRYIKPNKWRRYVLVEKETVEKTIDTFKELKRKHKAVENLDALISKQTKLLEDLPKTIETNRNKKREMETELKKEIKDLKRTKFQ